MTRRLTFAGVCALSIGLAARAAFAQSVDDIVARNLQAKGGLEKIKAIQSVKQTAHVLSSGQDQPTTITMYGKRPNWTRQEMVLPVPGGATVTVVSAFDGTTAWGINPAMGMTSPTAIEGPQADMVKAQADFDGPFVNYKEKGTKIEFVGTEPLGTRRVYHLKITDKTGQVTQAYLDAETALEVKTVRMVPPIGIVEQELSDYRDVNGLKLPFAIKSSAGGMMLASVTVDTVEFNVPLADALFKLPGKQ